MRFRWFTCLLSAIALAWPVSGQAQQLAHKIGFLGPASPEPYVHILEAFREGLKASGFTEGQNLAIEYRWADDQYERLPTLAAELVQQRVEVIFTASGTQTAKAAQAATSTIPVVFVIGTDPVKFGLVASMNRPGGNVTGVTLLTTSMAQKRLDVLREMVPKATRRPLAQS
jgi:putative ABC transport system substrate-binding protein